MKKVMLKVMVLAMVMLFMAPALFLQNAAAAGGWVTATVNKVGPGGVNADIFVYLTDTATTPHFAANTFFKCSPTRAKEMLATALTAASLGKPVYVQLTAYAAGSTITSMYLVN